MSQRIRELTIVGGGTAGWMAAAALSKVFNRLKVTLVESDSIGTVGVGEATIPTLLFFNQLLGIDEREFIRETQATFKLGIQFEGWRSEEHQYFHGFGATGKNYWAAGFHNFWRRGMDEGIAEPFGRYCREVQAAQADKFFIGSKSGLNYAYHLDATKYGRYLRKIAERNGATRIEGKVARVVQCETTGNITSVDLDNGKSVEGDLFIDCTGFAALLIEQTLQTGYDDWSHLLPCDRAIALQTELTAEPKPYTRAVAHKAGWRWEIPLQHRRGNGIVYSSEHLGDDEAFEILSQSVVGKAKSEPNKIRFVTGKRKLQWNKNCIALGLAGGFLEPLESTSIHLIQQNILKLIKLFPASLDCAIDREEFNRRADAEYRQVLDFIVLHYCLTERQDSPFWQHCGNMKVPDSLARRMTQFKETGRFFLEDGELFVDSWFQVMIGQGLIPKTYHSVVDEMPKSELATMLGQLSHNIQAQVSQLPTHAEFLKRYLSV
ncbi:tryptophan 7-halogenase [Gilvimarinus sp. SDUM040013]|uniref:Tryptophan halogenase family protein n=1 Tax=Gilvimarinus gilvus TaxID=3058038 RepID=A0ABU4S2I3_9GAMM|nr:tryptophan halogenase family protein [Gilvimarinus sp. SDUM040013]MDO3385896.1 tryptophan 7-halogenase [Gilvimarinus sp. SDUM040013]MDX6850601.1 tryptophan halogenase family protein [Gilvimarinus sp. SDUM040013]